MKIWKVALVSTLAITLVLGAVLPALAAPDDEAPLIESKPLPRLQRGEVVSIGESSFTIQSGEQEIEIKVNEGTRYFKLAAPARLTALFRNRISQMQGEGQEQLKSTPQRMPKGKVKDELPSLRSNNGLGKAFRLSAESQILAPNPRSLSEGNEQPKRLQGNLSWLRQFGEEVTFADMAIGNRVVVWTAPSEGEPLAKLVLIMTSTASQRITGTISEINEADMTITLSPLSDTEDVTFSYDNSTTFTLYGTPFLKEGATAIVTYVETTDGPLAKRVVSGIRIPEPVEQASL